MFKRFIVYITFYDCPRRQVSKIPAIFRPALATFVCIERLKGKGESLVR